MITIKEKRKEKNQISTQTKSLSEKASLLENSMRVKESNTQIQMTPLSNSDSLMIQKEEDKGKTSYESMKSDTKPISEGLTMTDLEDLTKFSTFWQTSQKGKGVSKLILPEFYNMLGDIESLKFEGNSMMNESENLKIQQYENIGEDKSDEKKLLLTKLPYRYQNFEEAKNLLRTSLEEEIKIITKDKLKSIIEQKQNEILHEQSESLDGKPFLNSMELTAIMLDAQEKVQSEPTKSEIFEKARENVAQKLASKTAPALCNFISHYIFYRATGKISKDISFGKWYARELKEGDIKKNSSGALNYGAKTPLGNTEEDADVKVEKYFNKEKHLPLLNSSGTRVAIVRDRGHFHIIVKDTEGEWHNLDHTSRKFDNHGGYIDWSKVTRLIYDPNADENANKILLEEAKKEDKNN